MTLGGSNIYYGSIDATPLFVMLLGELRRWGLATSDVDALLPHADRALEWIERYGDRDGDGFVEYQRATDRGLINQGWKDSFDGISFAGGRLAELPIALAEVQGYAYAAFLARAHFAREAGDATCPSLVGASDDAQATVQRSILACRSGLFRQWRSMPRSARLTHWHPTWATASGPASSTRTRRPRSPVTS